jgi:HPr kinase/phosphorylase
VDTNSPNSGPGGITVGDFIRTHGEALHLKLVGPEAGMDRKIREATINRPGLGLAGFYRYFAWKRIQVFGSAELAYLKSLPEADMRQRFHALCQLHIPCAVFSRSAVIPPALLDEARAARVAVFRTPMVTKHFVNAATIALENDFAPTVIEHGSMVDILGIGVFIRGASGIGKSECVLSLIERGYSLVADDVTRFRGIEHRELMGTSPPLTRHHMEIRGLGVINVASVFGVGAIRDEKRLDVVVTLMDWQDCPDIDRIGLDPESYTILDIVVPCLTIPVRPGRDMARLVEVAALDQKLKAHGYDGAAVFNQRLIEQMQKKSAKST